jgi:hypothetical protein
MNMYLRFSLITIAFMIVNSNAFLLGQDLLKTAPSMFSVAGVLAIVGVLLANCAAIQMILASKYDLVSLFYLGVIPIIGFFIAFFVLTRSSSYEIGLVFYCLAIVIGVALLALTYKQSEMKKSLAVQ